MIYRLLRCIECGVGAVYVVKEAHVGDIVSCSNCGENFKLGISKDRHVLKPLQQ